MAIAPKEPNREPSGLLIAMVATRSSAPLSNIERKIALIGRADPSDNKDPQPLKFRNYLFVLHPAYSFRSPAMGIDRLPFNPKKGTKLLYGPCCEPLSGLSRAVAGWFRSDQFPGTEDHFYVVVQSRDWIFTLVAATFGIALAGFLAVLAKNRKPPLEGQTDLAEIRLAILCLLLVLDSLG